MKIAEVPIRNFIPITAVMLAAYVLAIVLQNEALSIGASIMTAGLVALISTIALARGFRSKAIEAHPVVIVINFPLTLFVVFYLLRVVADTVVSLM